MIINLEHNFHADTHKKCSICEPGKISKVPNYRVGDIIEKIFKKFNSRFLDLHFSYIYKMNFLGSRVYVSVYCNF